CGCSSTDLPPRCSRWLRHPRGPGRCSPKALNANLTRRSGRCFERAEMARIDHDARRLTLTLVVWGARRVGKSALLGALRDRLVEDGREDALAVPLGGPLLDWLPLSLGPIGEWHVHLDLYAVAGGTHHEVTR